MVFLAGGGDLGDLMRSHDWDATPLGDPAEWSPSLKSTLALCLDSAFPIAIYWGPELVLLYNDAWRPILGDKHPWALGRPAKQVWPEIWEAIEPVFGKVVQEGTGSFHHDSLLSMHRHGYVEECYFDYTFNPIRDADGRVAGILNVVTETTFRVLAERRSRVLRDVAAALSTAKTTSQVLDLTIQGLRQAGPDVPFAAIYTQEGDGHALAAIGAETGATVAWPLAEALAAGRALTVPDVERRFGAIPVASWPEPIREALILPVAAPGRLAPEWLLVVGANPRRGLDGEYVAFLESIASHIGTSLANAAAFEAERRRAESLAELDRAKTVFFSNVSHELRTPLTLMLGPVRDLLDSSVDVAAAPQRELLQVVERNGQRLLKLVNSLLDFSRIEAGRMKAVREPVDLAAYTAELASVFRSAIERAGMRLVVDCPPLSKPAFVDRDMWEKIVLNLVSNAFKYTLEGEIRVSLDDAGELARLSVEDTGIGIPEDERPRIFERFHRVDGAQGRTQEGSGIGLALVQELVKLHGGTVAVVGTDCGGSRFTVTMPVRGERVEMPSTPASPPASTGEATAYVDEALHWLPEEPHGPADGRGGAVGAALRSRILLADDNADMRSYVARLLASHEVVAVGDGQQALDAVRAQPFDLVLTDVMMPRLDGFGLLRALRNDPATATVPVIMLSARAGEEARVEGHMAGADDYLVKPFSARELQARVDAQLALRRLRHEALERERALRSEAQTLNTVAEQLVAELDLPALVQKVTDAATALTGAQFGAFFYNVVDDQGEAYQLFTLSGAPRSAFEGFGMPRNTPIFAPTFRGGEPVRLDDVTADARYGTMPPHHGQPQGHLPVKSYLAVPVKTRAGEVLGGLFFGHAKPAVFTEHAERLAVGIAALAAVAMDNARLYQAARESDRRKDEFLATLAHELRNPLAPLRNGVEILHRIPLQREALDPVCRMMGRQLDHIVRLIDDLLDLSRISRGMVTLQTAPTAIARVLQSAIEASQPMLEARHHRLSLSTPPDSAWIEADATRLTQVFSNLLNNAAKFTPEGGQIDVVVLSHRDEVEVRVKDTGIGIPPAMLERVFDMFSQLEDPIQKSQPGLGIGLTLVRQLVELHGGTVRAESAGLGSGVTMVVVLPALAQGSTAQAQERHQRPDVQPLRVLVADDNVDAALSLGEMLGLDGHEVRTVHAGADAVREAAAFSPHVVLLDLGMPGMDGFEACRRIRQSQAPGPRPVIAALTGWGYEDHQARAREAGFDRHIVKPADPAKVVALLAEVAGRSQ